MENKKTNFSQAREYVEFGLREKSKGNRESASGPGSFLSAAAPTLSLLRKVIDDHDISSILDLGCGDWNWMQHLELRQKTTGSPVTYEGWDANEKLIEGLNTHYGIVDQVDFKLRDLVTDTMPPSDLIIIRDVLFHMPVDLAQATIANIKATSRYMIATTFLGVRDNIGPEKAWGFYNINLMIKPFKLNNYLLEAHREPECSWNGFPRFVCLFDFGEADS